jgi:hypothetical protein
MGGKVFKKLGFVVALGLLAGMMAIGPVAAAGAPASSVLVANGQWQKLPAGQQAWYTFDYSGDQSQILIRMAAPNGGGFEVWTPEQFASYQAGNTVDPVGRGSASDYFGGDLIWSGNFNSAGTYYVIVDAGSSEADYTLTITGSGVTLPAAAAQPAKSATAKVATAKDEAETAAAAKAEAAKVASATAAATVKDEKETASVAKAEAAKAAPAAAKKGAGASDALTIDGKWANIAANQQVWYAIPYGGGNSQMIIRMAVDPNHPASFAVYTANEVANGADPVGIGSANADMGGDLVWAGGFQDATTVYVVVSGNSMADSGYALSMQ